MPSTIMGGTAAIRVVVKLGCVRAVIILTYHLQVAFAGAHGILQRQEVEEEAVGKMHTQGEAANLPY